MMIMIRKKEEGRNNIMDIKDKMDEMDRMIKLIKSD
jgi:hypothetical protein